MLSAHGSENMTKKTCPYCGEEIGFFSLKWKWRDKTLRTDLNGQILHSKCAAAILATKRAGAHDTRDDAKDTYYCRNCGAEISRERYEDYDQLCESCEDSQEDSEGDGLMSEGDIMFPEE
jgi:hypothetical protein